eukprot:10391402-Lingulodinium_polyedra.AAC.2
MSGGVCGAGTLVVAGPAGLLSSLGTSVSVGFAGLLRTPSCVPVGVLLVGWSTGPMSCTAHLTLPCRGPAEGFLRTGRPGASPSTTALEPGPPVASIDDADVCVPTTSSTVSWGNSSGCLCAGCVDASRPGALGRPTSARRSTPRRVSNC